MGFDEVEKYFRLTRRAQEDVVLSARIDDLVDDVDCLENFLRMYASRIGSRDLHVASASFSKWFAFVTAGFQYFISVRNVYVDLPPKNLAVELHRVGDYDAFSFRIDCNTESEGPLDGHRRASWREKSFKCFYRNTVRPLIEAQARVTGINAGQLWGQFPPKLVWFVEVLGQGYDDALVQRIADDYRWLKHEMDPSIFGRKRNPFDIKWRAVESLEDPNKQVYIQPACCMDYRREDGIYCYTCPRLKETQRALRRDEFRAAVSGST